MPYIPTYARQLGVPSSGVGIMYAVFPFIGLVWILLFYFQMTTFIVIIEMSQIAKPSFGALADKFKKGKIIFISAIICTAIFFGSISFIPPKTTEAFMELECNGNTHLKICNVSEPCVLDKIEMEFQDEEIMECKLLCSDPNPLFLTQMCNEWNISETCYSNLTQIEMTILSNITDSNFEETCLYFPVGSVMYNSTEVKNPQCYGQIPPIQCSVLCNSSTVMGLIQNSIIEQLDEPYYKTIQFQMLFGLMAGAWAAQAVVVSLSDAICFKLLGNLLLNPYIMILIKLLSCYYFGRR